MSELTEEEYHALPVGSVVKVGDGPHTYTKVDDNHWETNDEDFKAFQVASVKMLEAIAGDSPVTLKPWFTDNEMLPNLEVLELVPLPSGS